MKKLICQVILFTGINSFSQPQEFKLLNDGITAIDGESFVLLPEFKKIESLSAPVQFQIKGGALNISAGGMIDKSASSPVVISLFVQEFTDNKLIIFAKQGSQAIEYKIEGSGSGLYSGQYNRNSYFMIKTRFKITAAGYPSYFLEIPLYVYISLSGVISFEKSFAEGVAYIHNAGKKKRIKRMRSM